MNENYKLIQDHLRKVADLNYAAALLQWDQEVYMPENGAAARANQLATLSGIAHECSVDARLGELLKASLNDASLSDKELRNVMEAFRNYTDKQKYTAEFVVNMSRTVSDAFNSWQQAKERSDFSLFAPHLEKLVALKLQECELLGYKDHPYDALINQHEPGCTTRELKEVFEKVKQVLVPIVKSVIASPQSEDDFTHKKYERQKQWDFGIGLLKEMGFDFSSGRQDISSHPFTINFNSRDVRVTTRINEHDLCEMIWSCIHEGGHALYEQGLPYEEYGMPSGEYLSLGIHESQSRLWENNVGRSLAYWSYHFPKLKAVFPEELASVTPEHFYAVINRVSPSLIRTNADELTYHLHVLIRFEIEIALMEGKVAVKDLPQLWNSKYKEYLGVDVPSDAKGVLQDVHWSHGSFGYFPTYSLGSFYAAQFYNKALHDIPELEQEIAKGNTSVLLEWLRTHIHAYGRLYTATELCTKITGKPLDFDEFMIYVTRKFPITA